MTISDNFGNVSNNNGVFGNSLIDDATLVKPLTENLSPLEIIKPKDKNSAILDPFARQDELASSYTNPNKSFIKSFEEPSLFNQSTIPLPVIYQPENNGDKTNFYKSIIGNKDNALVGSSELDKLTGTATNTPLVNVASIDPLLGSSNNSLLPIQPSLDTTPPQLIVTVLPLSILPGSPQARLVGTVTDIGSAVASLTVQFDDLAASPVSVSPLGLFDKPLDFTGLNNGPHTLKVNAADYAGNISTASFSVTLNLAPTPPTLAATLTNDTAPGGTTNTDGITFDPTTAGTVLAINRGIEIKANTGSNPLVNATANVSITETNRISQLKARFDNTQVSNSTSILNDLNSNGSFTLDRTRLNAINGSLLPDGAHTLHLEAVDKYGVVSVKDIRFTLDTITGAPNINLSATSDSGISNSDRITKINTPVINGTAEAGATVKLSSDGQLAGQANVDSSGNWQLTTPQLTSGAHNFSAIATDIAGNVSLPSSNLTVTIDSALPQLNLTTPITQSTLTIGDKLTGSVNGTGSAVTELTYRFNNQSEVPVSISTTGTFDQALDLTGLSNGSHTLTLTTTDTAGNIATNQYNVTVVFDNQPPVITAYLVRDTAPNNITNTDSITFDITVSGTVTDASEVSGFHAGFDNTPVANFTNVLPARNADGSFTFNRTQLETIKGGTLPDGVHTLHLQAFDKYGNLSNVLNLTFTQDTTLAVPTFNLELASDSGVVGDYKTKFDIVTLVGTTEANAIVTLEQTGANIVTDNTGKFTFTSVALAKGNNTFTIKAIDIAGNSKTSSINIYRFSPPTAINLTGNTIAENSAASTVIGQIFCVDPDIGDTHSYTLIDDAGGRFKLVDNSLQVANGNLLNFEARAQHTVIIRSTDKNGLTLDETFTIGVTNVNEAPIFTSTPANTTIEAGSTFTYNITTTDPDAEDTHALTATGLPDFLTLTDNGNGTATITGTPNQNQLGLFNIAITATDAGGLKTTQNIVIGSQITLREQNNFSPERSFPLIVPTTPSIFRFKIDPIFDNLDPDSINDAFEVALVDEDGNSLVHTIAKGRDAFFNLTEGENAALGAGASYDDTTKTVSLNLTGVKAGNANLIFRLVNNDSDTTTNVKITDFAIIAAPTNTTAPTQTTFTPEISSSATPNFNALTDVSKSLAASYGNTSFNSDTGLLYTDISIKNTGTYNVDAPVLIAIKNITDPSVILRDADGVTPDGIPYYDFTSLVAGGKLNKGGETSERTLVFYNPLNVQFDYEVVVLAQLNIKPVIESKPVTEIIAGKQYKYSVVATDKNGDALNYKLLTAPPGMTISATGSLIWDTTASNKGNQSIVVEVSDGRGGVETQVFTLSVIEAPSNRPPIFTTTPVVDAYINKEYKYDADAIDPDENNPITYNLITGPDGMTLNPNTGESDWTPAPVLNLGDTILGRIGVPGENDEFTFSGTKGQRIYFDPLQYTGVAENWRLDVYSPSGIKVIDGANFNWNSNQLITLIEDGNYRVVVDAVGDSTGTYAFSVINTSLAPAVAFDNVVKGKLSPGSSDNVYRFTGNKGQKLYFDSLGNSGGLDWVLYDATNQYIETYTSGNFNEFEIDLPTSGEYILALRGNSEFSGAVDYSFTIITPDINTKPLTLGNNANLNIISDVIKEKGEQNVYTFTGSIGQRLYLDTIANGYYTTNILLESPSGIKVFNYDLSDGNFGVFTLAENGSYRLIVDGRYGNTDPYSFSLLDAGLAESIQKDTDVSGQLNPGAATHFYQFVGTLGERLYFDSLLNGANTNWYLITPDNQIAKNTYSVNVGSDFEITLSQTGNYTLVITGNNGDPADYKFRVITPQINVTTLTLGSNGDSHIVSGVISEKGEQNVYTFTGTIGQRLSFDTITNGYYTTRVYLYSPSGITIFDRDLTDSNKGPFTLTETGTYRLVVDGNGESTDAYSFSMRNVDAAVPVTLDTDVTGQLNPGQETHFYQFTGTTGQRLYLDSLMSVPNTYWDLVGPDNQIVLNTNMNDDMEVTLKSTGAYVLAIYGFNDAPVDYKFQIITPNTDQGNLTSGVTVNGEIIEKGEQDVYTFIGSKGQRLYFDAINGNNNITAKLLNPSGVDIWSGYGNTGSDIPSTVLFEAGNYRLIIDGNGDTTGSYSFRFIDTSTVESLALGVPTNGSLAPNQTQLYSINGIAGQRLQLDSLTPTQSADWVLYVPGTLPSGNSVLGSANLNDDFEVVLPTTGIYTLALRSSATSIVDYQIKVNNITSVSVTNTGIGSIRTGNVSTQQPVNHTFTAQAGTRLYIDSLVPYDQYYHGVIARLLDENNNVVVNYFNASGDSGVIMLQESGSYTFSLEGEGDYSYQILDLGTASNLDLNSVTNVTLNPGRSTQVYKFTGTVGQKLFYDGLNSENPETRAQIITPSGYRLFDVRANSDAWLYNLNEEGTYYLLLSGDSSTPTNVSFRLFDQNSALPVDLDTDFEGSFSSGSTDVPLYRFTGTEGQHIYINAQAGGYPNRWYIYTPGGNLLTEAFIYDDQELTLPTTGEYLLALYGNGSDNVNYKFRIVTPEKTTTALNEEDTNSGAISEAGENDTYTFTGAVGQQLFFDALNPNDPNFTVRLYTPSGYEIYRNAVQNDRGPDTTSDYYGVYPGFTLTETGTYRLVIDGNGDATGDYSFRLLNKADASATSFDTDIVGSFAGDGIESHTYRFTGTEGQYVYFDSQAGGYPNAWILYGPGGQYVTSDQIYNDREFALTATGEYFLIMQGNAALPADYKLRIVTPEFEETALTLNQPVNGTISEQGENDTYTFNGTVGQQLYFDALNTNSTNITVRLFNPSGNEVYRGPLENDRGPETIADYYGVYPGFVLTETGRYRLVIDGNGDTVGDYNFRLRSKPSVLVPELLDRDITGDFGASGRETDLYAFNGAAGQYIYVDIIGGNYYDYWTLYGPGGNVVTYNRAAYDGELALPATGKYMFAMYGSGSGDTNYTYRLVTPDFETTKLNFNSQISNSISEPGENDTYTFNGTAGQQLYFDANDANDPNFTVRIISPSGKEIYSGRIQDDRGPETIRSYYYGYVYPGLTLNETGSYSLIVDGNGDSTGDYNFRLLDISTSTPLTIDTDITQSFGTNSRETDVYRFSATTGEYIYIDNIDGNYSDYWTLYGPGGQVVTGNYTAYDGELALPTTGEYALFMYGSGNGNTNYTVHITKPVSGSSSLTLNSTTSGSISKRGENDTYTFNGNAGQQLFFDAIAGNSSIKARLISPSGVTIVDKDTNTDWGAFNLGEAGTYQLVIDGEGATVGDYSFRLLDRNSSQNIKFGATDFNQGSINPGNQVNLYKFNGKSGQSLNFNLDNETWNGANWVLYDPSGQTIKTPLADNPDFNVTLGAAGLYTLAIIGNSDTPVNYKFTVTDTSTAPVTNNGIGLVQSGTLNASEVIDYQFTATAGTQIIFDGQFGSEPNNYLIRARLLNPDGTYVFDNHVAYYDTYPIVLEQSGNYKVQIYGYYGDSTGDYKFNLLELPRTLRSPNLNYLEIGGVDDGTLNSGQGKVYTFDGVSGQKVLFNAMVGDNVTATLYDASGQVIYSKDNFRWDGDSKSLTLTTTGLHYLVVKNDDVLIERDYSFQLLDLGTSQSITYSLPVSGSLDNGQTTQTYKISAQKGERLYFDNISSTTPSETYYYRWKLYGYGSEPLFDNEQRQDAEIIIPETGEYYLAIQGGLFTEKVDYNFRVLRHSEPIRDVITPGNGLTSSNSTDSIGLFNVKLSAKDSLGATSIQEYNIKLWADPTNSNPVITSTAKTKFSLADKVYQYKLTSVDPDNDPLVYRLLDAPLGALIDNETGELLWFPEASVTPGSQVNFKVEVSDRRGGKDIQSFAVDVYDNLGKIQGAVFDDLNGNGLLDSKLVKGDNPAIVFAIDVSGSTKAPFFGDESNPNVKTVLDAQVAAIEAMVDAVVAQGAGDKVKFGIIPHKFNAVIQDMDNATPGLQIYTTATADTNNNGIADIREILASYRPDGNNNFTTALQTIDSLFDALPGDPNLIFMSDGYGPLDPTVASTVVADIKAKGGNVTAFGVGLYSTIETIKKIDPDAERITDFDRLISIFSGFDDRYAIEPLKENVTVYLDLNNNGVLDKDEPSRITKKNTEVSILGTNKYNYTFDDLLPGTYTVRTIVPAGYNLTTPTTGAFIDTITVAGEDYRHLAGIGKISEPVNVDPVFVTTPDKYRIKAGENLIYRAVATDANADPLNYDLILAPPGMTFDNTTGTVVWSPSKQIIEQYYTELKAERERLTALGRGEFARNTVELNVGLRVRDGKGGQALQYINVELLPDNIAPVFTSAPKNNKAQVDKTFRYQATALNTDGDALVYSLIEGASLGVNITNTGLVTWTPNSSQLGNQEFTIKVTDGFGGETLQLVSLVVGPNLPNTAPDITSTPRTVVRQGNTYFYKVEASDVDGDALTYSLATKPTGMEITQDGFISWTPSAAQFGNYTVSLDVSDGTLITNQEFVLNVTNFVPNYAPTITSTPNLITNLERTYEYNLTATDPDNDLLLWSLDTAPDGMVLDAITGALRWQPNSTQIGEHTVLVRATDAYGAYNIQEFTLTARGTNTPPAIVSNPVTIAATNQVYTYNVVATDVENDELTYSLGRRPIGMTITDEGKVEWKPLSNQIGSHTVEVIARDSQGATSTQTFTIEVGTTAINNAPTITSTPKFVAPVGSPYTYQVVATDSDAGDTLTYQILSKPDNIDVRINATTGLLTWDNPTAGQYQIVVGAVDKGGLGTAQRFTLTARANNAPVINSTAPDKVTPGSTYAYDVKATDADGDKLTYSLDSISLDKGMTVDALGRLRWAPTISNAGSHAINLTVSDGNGGSATETINLNVARDTEAPKIRLIALNNTANLGDDITFQARATDNVKVASLKLTVDGTPVVLDANGIVTVKASRSGTISAVALATDTSGNTKQETFDVLVVDPTDVEAPTVSFKLEGINDGDFVKAPTSIRATITDDGQIDYYRLLVAPINGGEFKELWRNDNPTVINNGLLVEKFDPSLLQNDSYIVRLEVADNGGKISYSEQTVDVAGELKLGNFRLSFTDLEIPVTGIPITLTRTYDTLTSNTSDDFGYGWRMEFRDTDLRTSVGKPSEEEQILGRQKAFKDGTKVYITLPGGKREAFTFKPKMVEKIDGEYIGIFAKYFYTPEFVADKGGTSTLTVDSQFITLNRNTNEFMGFAGNGYNPADSYFGGKYTLTTFEGVKYEIDALTGDLLTVTDTNGSKLTYTDDAITSSTGQKVTFERDAQGRIKSVLDPMGELIKYEYDDSGDLISVTDREGNTTRITYNTQRKHYLDQIIDPLGRTGVRNEYGSDGRLKKVFDANGTPVEIAYNPDNFVQTVKDALGNSTTFEYDERGNIVTEVNALGQITRRIYDEYNNLLSETTPEGRTTRSTYDARGNKLSVTDPLGNTTNYTYNSLAQKVRTIDPLGNVKINTYDRQGNLLSFESATGSVIKSNFDSSGRQVSLVSADGSVTEFNYDRSGNVITQTDASGNEIKYTYNANGKLLSEAKQVVVNGELKTITTRWTYDFNGKVTSVTNPVGNTTRYKYDLSGNISSIIDSMNRETRYIYDAKGQLIESINPDGTSRKQNYDILGRKVAEIDELGRTTRFIYDALGRLVETILPDDTPEDLADNPKQRTEYNRDGLVAAEIGPRGNRTEYVYDLAGRVTLSRDALGNETTYTYNAKSVKLSETDALGRTTRFVFDEAGRQIKTIFADDTSISNTYNAVGLRDTSTDQAGRTTYYRYDSLRRLVETILPDSTPDIIADNPKIRWEYDQLGRSTAQIDPSGLRTEYSYDEAGRLISIRDQRGEQTFTYDAVGNRISETDTLGRTTQFIYNAMNRLVETRFPDGTQTRISYDAVGNINLKTDELGRQTQFTYDVQDRLTGVINALNQQTEYGYDLAGNLIRVKDANNNITSYEYDALNRRTSVILPLGQRSEMTYNAVGNISTQKDFNGNTIRYEYNLLNRLVTKRFQDNTVVLYSYTPTGSLSTTTDTNGLTTYTYDTQDRLLSRTDPDGRTISYTYDIVGNRTSVTTPGGKTRYIYDQFHRLSQVIDIDGKSTQYTYDAVNNLTRTELPNGTFEVREYDLRNRLNFLEQRNSNGVIASYRYTLDRVGNRTQIVEQNGRQSSYSYDPLNRLIQEVITDPILGNLANTFTYDPVGNRLTQNSYTQGLTTYTYDANDRLLSETHNGVVTNYSYDNNGNTLSRSNPTEQVSYQWDFENHLKGATTTTTNGTQRVQYRYNPDGVRVATTVDGAETRYLVDTNQPSAQVLEEYGIDGELQASYVFGHNLISQKRDDAISYYHADGLGSIRLLTNTSAQVTDSYVYDAYGNILGSTGNTVNSYRYTGEQFDQNLGEYYLRARYYNPSTGRFTARDPFAGFLDEPLSLGKYPYVHGNPVNFTDPSGLFPENPLTVIILQSILSALPSVSFTTAITLARVATPIIIGAALVATYALADAYLATDTDEDDYNGLPIVFFTNRDLPMHRRHINYAQTGFGFPKSFYESLREGTVAPTPQPLDSVLTYQGFRREARLDQAVKKDRSQLDNSIIARALGILPQYINGREYYDIPSRSYARDEYPFATTEEGGPDNWDNDLVSVEVVTATESNRQGQLLDRFYNDPGVGLVARDPSLGIFGVLTSPVNTTNSGYIRRDGTKVILA